MKNIKHSNKTNNTFLCCNRGIFSKYVVALKRTVGVAFFLKSSVYYSRWRSLRILGSLDVDILAVGRLCRTGRMAGEDCGVRGRGTWSMAGVGDVGGVRGRGTGRIPSPYGCTLLLLTGLTCAGGWEPGDAGGCCCCCCRRSEELLRIPWTTRGAIWPISISSPFSKCWASPKKMMR